MFPIKPTQEAAMPGPLGASNRYRTAVRAQFEALHNPASGEVEAQSDSDPFKVDTRPEPERPVSQAPIPRVAATIPARLPWNHPKRKAEREANRSKSRAAHLERVAKYIREGVDEQEAEDRARRDAHQEITRAS